MGLILVSFRDIKEKKGIFWINNTKSQTQKGPKMDSLRTEIWKFETRFDCLYSPVKIPIPTPFPGNHQGNNNYRNLPGRGVFKFAFSSRLLALPLNCDQ